MACPPLCILRDSFSNDLTHDNTRTSTFVSVSQPPTLRLQCEGRVVGHHFDRFVTLPSLPLYLIDVMCKTCVLCYLLTLMISHDRNETETLQSCTKSRDLRFVTSFSPKQSSSDTPSQTTPPPLLLTFFTSSPSRAQLIPTNHLFDTWKTPSLPPRPPWHSPSRRERGNEALSRRRPTTIQLAHRPRRRKLHRQSQSGRRQRGHRKLAQKQ